MRAAPVWVKRIDASNGSRAPAAAKSGYGVNGEIARPHPEKAGDEGLPRRKDVFVTQDRSADDRRVFVHGNNEKEAKKNQLFFSPSHISLPSSYTASAVSLPLRRLPFTVHLSPLRRGNRVATAEGNAVAVKP